jgi:acyl-CoA thioester hydrolase
MSEQPFKLDLEVRDYECDIEGIVNNAVYMNYLEHTRHAFLKHKGLNFAELTQKGIRLVVIHIEADYLYPLRSGDIHRDRQRRKFPRSDVFHRIFSGRKTTSRSQGKSFGTAQCAGCRTFLMKGEIILKPYEN